MRVSNKAIGILGGSFDPPHIGHIKISRISIKKFKLKKLYWIITKKNPFKDKPYFLLKDRILKSKKITRNVKKIEVLYLDEAAKSSRIVNILSYIIKKKHFNNLYLILGADNLIKFHKWTKWKKIVKMVKLVVFSRRGYDKNSKRSIVVKFLNKKNIIFIKNKLIDISSSKIRKKIQILSR